MHHQNPSRRRFVRNFALGAAGLWVPGAFAEALTQTAIVMGFTPGDM